MVMQRQQTGPTKQVESSKSDRIQQVALLNVGVAVLLKRIIEPLVVVDATAAAAAVVLIAGVSVVVVVLFEKDVELFSTTRLSFVDTCTKLQFREYLLVYRA
jgi:hypothetical protein